MSFILPQIQWDKAIDAPCFDYSSWQEFERRLLPSDTVFPQEGQIWEAVHDCDVTFHASIPWSTAPLEKVRLTDGSEVKLLGGSGISDFPGKPGYPMGTARILKGERFRVIPGFDGPKTTRAALQPLRYKALEKRIIPQAVRAARGYRGYRLHVATARPRWCLHPKMVTERCPAPAYLNEDFKLVA